MLSYYSFESKYIRRWKKLNFHLLDLVVVNAHISHNKTSKKKCLWEFSMIKSSKDYSLVPVQKFKYKVSLVDQLADLQGETIPYVGFQRHMLSWRRNLSAHVV